MNKKIMSTMTVAGLATIGGMTDASADTKYTIEKGDTLSHLALEYATSVRQIAADNNIVNPDMIFAGETLWINGVPTQVRPATVAPATADVATQQAPVAASTVEEQATAAPKTVEVEKPAVEAVAPQAVEVEKPVAEAVAPKTVEVEKPVAEVVAPKVETTPEVQVPVAPQAIEEISTPMVQAPQAVQTPVQPKQVEQVQPQVNREVAPVLPSTPAPVQPQVNQNLSVYDRFLNAGGTDDMWNIIVMPESGGNPEIVSPNGYHGLGQTKEAWGVGTVEEQTAGMLNYAQQRYGSVAGAMAFRLANGWW